MLEVDAKESDSASVKKKRVVKKGIIQSEASKQSHETKSHCHDSSITEFEKHIFNNFQITTDM